MAALLAFLVLAYGDHEAWIAQWNLARHRATGQLDVPYLVWSLSLDGVPVLVQALETLPPKEREELRQRLHERYGGEKGPKACRWFEWKWRAGAGGGRAWNRRASSPPTAPRAPRLRHLLSRGDAAPLNPSRRARGCRVGAGGRQGCPAPDGMAVAAWQAWRRRGEG